jgi:hypothetical protein
LPHPKIGGYGAVGLVPCSNDKATEEADPILPTAIRDGYGANVLDDRVHVDIYVDMPPPSRHRLPMIDFKFCSEVEDDPALPPSCELLAEDV